MIGIFSLSYVSRVIRKGGISWDLLVFAMGNNGNDWLPAHSVVYATIHFLFVGTFAGCLPFHTRQVHSIVILLDYLKVKGGFSVK